MINNAITSTCFINSFKLTPFSFTFGKFSLFLSLMLDKKIKPNIPGITGSKNNHIDKNKTFTLFFFISSMFFKDILKSNTPTIKPIIKINRFAITSSVNFPLSI